MLKPPGCVLSSTLAAGAAVDDTIFALAGLEDHTLLNFFIKRVELFSDSSALITSVAQTKM